MPIRRHEIDARLAGSQYEYALRPECCDFIDGSLDIQAVDVNRDSPRNHYAVSYGGLFGGFQCRFAEIVVLIGNRYRLQTKSQALHDELFRFLGVTGAGMEYEFVLAGAQSFSTAICRKNRCACLRRKRQCRAGVAGTKHVEQRKNVFGMQ